ncbi:MAG: DUF2203 domain-containing protein [Planctomycetota bacterium]|tara:strand:+ start:223 stop:657 length:435 start_codon:yes stop_codon:yes gene_type:complete
MARREQKLFELDEARSTLPLVSRIVSDIVEVTAQMKEIYLEIREVAGEGSDRERLDELQERLQEIADGRSEFFEELAALGVEMKDPNKGLIDFPALLDGRVVYLCWKLGEETVEHWHELTAGFDNREPVEGSFVPDTVVASNEV